jgi:hypothetical protein
VTTTATLRQYGLEITWQMCTRIAYEYAHDLPGECPLDLDLCFEEVLESVRRYDPFIGKRMCVTNEQYYGEDLCDPLYGTVLAPSPAWIGQYLVETDDDTLRYLYGRDM